MKKVRKRNKGENDGFSLIEVLLAIVLLGLIAAPILQMFYSSYAINQKSKKNLAAADLTQTTMEAISAQTYSSSKTVTGSDVYPGLSTYYETEMPAANGNIYKNPISGFLGPEYDSYTKQNEDKFGKADASGKRIAYYFSGVKYASYQDNDPFYCKLSFDTRNAVSDGYYAVEVFFDVYTYSKKDKSTRPPFTPGNLSSYTLLESVSTYVPNSRSMEDNLE